MNRKWPFAIICIALIALCVLMQMALIHGPMSVSSNTALKQKITAITATNAQLEKRNQKVYRQIVELKTNANATEVRAREELGLIKQGEIYYQYKN